MREGLQVDLSAPLLPGAASPALFCAFPFFAPPFDVLLLMVFLLFLDQFLDKVLPSDTFQLFPDGFMVFPLVPEEEKVLLPFFIL